MKKIIYNKLELVEQVSKKFWNVTLENTLLIACQHILKTNYQMFLSLFDKGLDPKNTFLLGKCYSTDPEALRWFAEKGVNVSKFSNRFDSHESFDESFDIYVKIFLKEIIKNVDFSKYRKIIILDDGGHLLKEANKLIKDTRNVVGIEQTSSGYEAIKNERLRFSVINVARSFAKLDHESPIIADLFVKNLDYELEKLDFPIKDALIIGNGPIGREILNQLSGRCNVLKFDKDISKSDFRDKEELKENLHKFDLIIGCTGKISFPTEFYSKLKKRVVLVSASSSDREFSAKNFRIFGERYTECHRNFSFRDIVLLNSGFPLTFTSHGLGAEGKDIQLTRALIFSSVLSAVNTSNEMKILELNSRLQKDILSGFYGGKNE